jgi:hypothetical protein
MMAKARLSFVGEHGCAGQRHAGFDVGSHRCPMLRFPSKLINIWASQSPPFPIMLFQTPQLKRMYRRETKKCSQTHQSLLPQFPIFGNFSAVFQVKMLRRRNLMKYRTRASTGVFVISHVVDGLTHRRPKRKGKEKNSPLPPCNNTRDQR